MQKHHFDIIIAGTSLASRIAAALLCKGGRRVMLLTDQDGPDTLPLIHCSLALARLMEAFGGRSCFTPVPALQVITPDNRLEIHGAAPLEKELIREFPGEGELIHSCLQTLQRCGEQLETLLWEQGGLCPQGALGGLSFSLKRSRSGVGKQLDRPLPDLLSECGLGAKATATLMALFAGLSCANPARLTITEASLLWAAALRPDCLTRQDMITFLDKRIEQFHGATEPLSRLKSVDLPGRQKVEITLDGGARCSADHLLLGRGGTLTQLPKDRLAPLAPAPSSTTFAIPKIKGELSPLLAPRLFFGGERPVQVYLRPGHPDHRASILCPEPIEADAVRKQIAPLFPFTQFALEPQGTGATHPAATDAPPKGIIAFAGAINPLQLNRQVFLCHGKSLVPRLACTGEVLTGLTTASILLAKGRQK